MHWLGLRFGLDVRLSHVATCDPYLSGLPKLFCSIYVDDEETATNVNSEKKLTVSSYQIIYWFFSRYLFSFSLDLFILLLPYM